MTTEPGVQDTAASIGGVPGQYRCSFTHEVQASRGKSRFPSSVTNNWSNVCTGRTQTANQKLCCLDFNVRHRKGTRPKQQSCPISSYVTNAARVCRLQFAVFWMCGVNVWRRRGTSRGPLVQHKGASVLRTMSFGSAVWTSTKGVF